METSTDQPVEVQGRTPKSAIALLTVVGTFLLFQLGVVVQRVWADGGGGSPSISVTPDTVSDQVSATAGEFRVDESGAATYSVPLYVVPGTAGVTPQLSISYSSQGSYGPLGMGWSLGGMSSVTRCRATREHGDFIVSGVPTDGTPEPVNFSASDKYCLDGQRLIPAQSAGTATCPAISGMTAVNLRTEIESFQRVCAYTPSSGTTGPAFFTVERKDGSKSWYGDRAADTADLVDGYLNATTTGKENFALAWSQTRFQDSTGNYIDYLYAEKPAGGTAGEQLISEIRYTGKKVLSGQSGSASAPYAKVVFNYSARPTTQWEYRYASGGQYVQSRRLDSVTVCATIACGTADQARHYVLTYGTTVSNSAREILTSLKECRDNTQGVCMAPTTFEWSQAKNELATSEITNPNTITTDPYKGFKFGDINGDGFQDMALLYKAGVGCTGGSWVVTMLGTLDGTGKPAYQGTVFNCVPADITARGDSAWQLFDYTGDGRDDLFVSSYTGTGWKVHPSTGTQFDMTTNLIGSLSPVIPSTDSATAGGHPQLTDLNGDGLMDVVYNASGLKVRLMERTGSTYGWGAERAATFISYPPEPCPPDSYNCTETSPSLWNPDIFRLVDFNGDAASDLIFNITYRGHFLEQCPGSEMKGRQGAKSVGVAPRTTEQRIPDDEGPTKGPVTNAPPLCPDGSPPQISWSYSSRFAYGVSALTATTVEFKRVMASPIPTTYLDVTDFKPQLGDFNGDGLTDLLLPGDPTYSGNTYYALNTGQSFQTFSLGVIANASRIQVADINGDGRSDVAFPNTGTSNKYFNVRSAQPDGTFAAAAAIPGGGSNAVACTGSNCDPKTWAHMFADVDGDAALDFLSFNLATSSLQIRFSRATLRHTPRDALTAIVNGFGARTELVYKPLTNNAVYRRDYGTRDLVGTNWGRGAPIQDLLAPMYVVAKASSSAPQDGNPSAMASLYYRYAGAKVQAGGRGYLGFREVVTFDPNQVGGYVGTVTTYSQNFPFVGMPAQTQKLAFSGQTYTPSTCVTGSTTSACYSPSGATQGFAPLGGSWFGNSQQSWEADTDNTASAAVFAAGVQAPLHVRTLGTDEQARDPFGGATTSRIATTFSYGAYGNVSGNTVDTYTNGTTLSGTVTTANSYTADDATRWRLGRLNASTVTHARPGKSSVVKTASFAYDMVGAYTGQMTQETMQNGGGVNQELRKVYALDAYGNRTRVSTCSTDIASCGSTAVAFHPTTATSINRYSRVVYDSLGRYPVTTYEPFWNGAGTSEQVTQTVVSRNLFGDVTQAYDLNGLDTIAVAGTFGRAYYSWAETVAGSSPGAGANGTDSQTTYRWCSGSGSVNCPNGAKFRQQAMADGAPTQWVYFDALGRPMMKAAQTFNAGVSGKDVVGVCTTYDGAGKPKRVSNPFFVAGISGVDGPTSLATVCTDAARTWTATTYDLLGRPTRVDAPDTTYSTLAYSGNQTTVTDPRGNPTVQLRNAAGELVSVTDALSTVTAYDYSADGNQVSVTRDAGRGQIQNLFQYDARGRKIQQVDPDAGTAYYEYNALGELILQHDGAGLRIEFEMDARGRVWRKTVKRPDTTVESQATFVFDTAPNGVGQPTSETITGTYTGWVGQPALAHSYSRGYGYDTLGRGITTSTTINSVTYTQTTVLDALGRAWKHQDVSGGWNKNEYSSRGYSAALCISDAVETVSTCPTAAWQRTYETDAWGNIVSEKRANSGQIPITRTYNPLNGRQTALCAGATSCNLINELYAWDNAGNLSTQQKEGRYAETFTYDALNRLTNGNLTMMDGVTVSNTVMHWAEYDKLGNICARMFQGQGTGIAYAGRAGCGITTGNGSGTSGFVGAHQVSYVMHSGGAWNYSWDARGNQTVRDAPGTANDRTIQYSLDDHAYEIATGNGKRTRYWYGPDGSRYMREDIDGNKTLYLGQVEVLISTSGTTYRRNIQGVLIKTDGAVPQVNRFIFTDRLGSVVKYTDGAGNAYQPQDYDEWGQRRDYDDPNINNVAAPTPTVALRGFTGHEMVDGQDMVNMNARMYDPMLGRFLQADPLIQAPENLQSWNAYTYVFNNPLTMVDPTGMFSIGKFLKLVAAIVVTVYTGGAAAGVWSFFGTAIAAGSAAAYGVVALGGFVAGAIQTGSLKGALFGAISAMAFYGVGQIGNAMDASTFMRAGMHGLAGGVMESLQGGSFGDGFLSAGLSKLTMSNIDTGSIYGDATLAAIAGGAISELTGGKFANGALTAAMQFSFNQLGQRMAMRGKHHLIIVGHKGDKYSQGENFQRGAQTLADSLRAKGARVTIVNAYDDAQFASALTSNGQLDGVHYFGHSGPTALYLNPARGDQYNLTYDEVASLDFSKLNRNAYIFLWGCNTAFQPPYQIGKDTYTTNIAEQFYLRSSRLTAGWTSGAHAQGVPSYNALGPAVPESGPIYWRPDNQQPATMYGK